MDDQPSHKLVQTAITALARMTHRGAVTADGKTGDGCGLLMKKPDVFLRKVAADLGFDLGDGDYCAGNLFFSQDDKRRDRSEEYTSELQSLMRISYAVFCLKKKKSNPTT